MDHQHEVISHARKQPDFVGAWVDQSISPSGDFGDDGQNGVRRLVLNLRFTGDHARHESEARAIWGGALCLSEGPRPVSELQVVQAELAEEMKPLAATINLRGVVVIWVVVAEADLQEALDERYGVGVTQVIGALRPAP